MIDRVAKGAAELRDAVEQFSHLSQRALLACTQHDELALDAALNDRDLLSKRVALLAQQLTGARRVALTPRARAAIDAVLRPVHVAAQRAARLNHELSECAERARNDVGAQLDRLRHDDAALSAYAAAAPRSDESRLDLTR